MLSTNLKTNKLGDRIPYQLTTDFGVVGLIEQWPGKVDCCVISRKFLGTLLKTDAGWIAGHCDRCRWGTRDDIRTQIPGTFATWHEALETLLEFDREYSTEQYYANIGKIPEIEPVSVSNVDCGDSDGLFHDGVEISTADSSDLKSELLNCDNAAINNSCGGCKHFQWDLADSGMCRLTKDIYDYLKPACPQFEEFVDHYEAGTMGQGFTMTKVRNLTIQRMQLI